MSKRVQLKETFRDTVKLVLGAPVLEGSWWLGPQWQNGDRVKVTVERLPAPRPKGGRK